MSDVVVHYEADEAWKIARTLAALDRLGVHAPRVVPRAELGRALAVDAPAWILRAGTAPRARAHAPPPSATGRPLLALGATHDFEGRIEPRWNALLRATGGCLDDHAVLAPHVPVPDVASVFAERAHAAVPLFAPCTEPRDATSPAARLVHVPAFDVSYSSRLRVVLAVTTLHRGGAERVVLDLMHALPARGVDVALCVLDAPQRDTYQAPPHAVLLYAHHRTRVARIEALARGARAWGADLIHAHLLDGAEIAALRARGHRVVVTAHNARAGWPAGYESPGFACEALLGCSLATTRALGATHPGALVRTAWNGVAPAAVATSASESPTRSATRAALGIPEDAFVLVSVANPRPQKRTERLVAVLEALVARGHDAHLVLVGGRGGADAAARDASRMLDDRIAQSPYAARVHRTGSHENPPALLAASDVFVSTSAYEGLSLAHLEAAAAGLPLVVTRVGGSDELAHLHASCTFLEPDAEPERFAVAIEAAAAAGRTKQAALHEFGRDAMAERHASLYGRIAACASHVESARDDLLLVTNNFSTGGAQSSARRLLLALRARGLAVRACVLEEQELFPTPGRRALEAAGLHVHVAPRAGLFDARVGAESVARLVDATKPRTVVFWNAIAEHKVLIADVLLGVRVFDVSPGEMFFRSLERYFARPRVGLPYLQPRDYGALLTRAVVKYEDEAATARAVLGADVVVIPNGVDVPAFSPRAARAGAIVLGTLARIGPDKKLEQLCDAFVHAMQRGAHCELRIAGDAETGHEDYAAALRARYPSVAWVGEHDARAFLPSLDAFALVAEPAGCPNASLEAMAAGLAVIATDVGGMREQVVPGSTGWLVPRGDARALGDAMNEACASRERLTRMGYAAWERARDRFATQRMVDDYVAALGL